MLHIGQDIHSLIDNKRYASEFAKQLHETSHLIVLTVNGNAGVVDQDADACQELVEDAERRPQQRPESTALHREMSQGPMPETEVNSYQRGVDERERSSCRDRKGMPLMGSNERRSEVFPVLPNFLTKSGEMASTITRQSKSEPPQRKSVGEPS